MATLNEINKRIIELTDEFEKDNDRHTQLQLEDMERLHSFLSKIQDENDSNDFNFLMTFIFI